MIASISARHLGTLTSIQLQAALDRFDLGRLLSATSIPWGNWGQNVWLHCSSGTWVLRGKPRDPWQFALERFFTQALHTRTTVPVAWPYYHDPTTDIFGWSFALMPELPGLQLIDPAVQATLDGSAQRAIARAMGETLAQIHAPAWPTAGWYDSVTDTLQPWTTSYAVQKIKELRDVIERYRQWCERHNAVYGRLVPDDLAWIDAVIADAGDLATDSFVPALVMGDFHERNVVVMCTSGEWRVSGVFDLALAHVGDGEADLSRIIAMYDEDDWALSAAFLSAYHQARPPRPGFQERFAFYMLYDRILIWVWAHTCDQVWDRRWTFREWAQRFMTPPQ